MTQRLDAFGAGWDLDVSGLGEPMAGRLRGLWARAASGAGPASEVLPYVVERTATGLSVDGVPHRATDAELPYLLSRALTMASIRRRTGQCLLLHAAGVSTPDGATVALVAASGTGKTTAARVLGQHLGYVSDETVAVEDDLTVRPWAKPLSVLLDPSDPFDKAESGPDELGLARAPERLHLAAVVLLARDPGQPAPVLEPVPLVEALAEVVPQTSALLRLPRPMESVVTALTTGGGPWRLRYAEVADCVELVAGLAAGSGASEPPVEWSTERGDEPPEDEDVDTAGDAGVVADGNEQSAGVDLPPGELLQRTPFRHAVHSEGSSFVVRGQVPAVLPGLASTLWRAAGAPVSLHDLVDAAVEAHGAHPEAEQLVTATVRALLASGHVAPAVTRRP